MSGSLSTGSARVDVGADRELKLVPPTPVAPPSVELCDRYAAVSNHLVELSKAPRLLHHLEVLNKGEVLHALAAGAPIPPLTYRAPTFDVHELHNAITNVEVPSGDLVVTRCLEEYRDHLLRTVELVDARGDRDRFQALSRVVSGAPDAKTVAYAREIATTLMEREPPRSVTAHEVKQTLEQALVLYGLDREGWRVEFSDKYATTVEPALRLMTVCHSRQFAADDPMRLAVHEVGVHCLRAANGAVQPLSILSLGTVGYEGTEEGLAAYAERLAGFGDSRVLRTYALRVLAVDSLDKGADISSTYTMLRELGCSHEEAGEITLRVHRGGGFFKDHVYLSGLLKVQAHLESGYDPRPLYVGKVGLDDLGAVTYLLKLGFLKPARFVPEVFNYT